MPNPPRITVRWTGWTELQDHTTARLTKGAQWAAEKASDEQTDRIFRRSQYYVPVDTHRLKDSGRVKKDKKGDTVQNSITYGGMAVRGKEVNYAVYVHEDPTKRHEAPTRYKFVETAYDEENAGAYDRFARYVSGRLEQEWYV